MKNKLLIFLTSVLLVSCASNGYEISGNVNSSMLEGKNIYIKERIERVWTDADSSMVTLGNFNFTGVCDSNRVVYLSFENNDGEKFRQPFVLENGKIIINIDTAFNIQVSGTPQNDLLATYLKEKADFYDRVDVFYKSNGDDSAQTAQQKAIFEQKMEAFTNEEVEMDLKFCLEHVNTIVGSYVFMSSFHGMNMEQKESVIAKMNSETKSIKRIHEIMDALIVEKKTAKGAIFTDIALPGLDGESLALSSLIGKTDYVLVDFWASWCGPCINSLPELRALYQKYKGKRFEILGVSLDDDNEKWRNAIKEHKLTWKHISDLKGWKSEGAGLYAVNSIPATVLIDKSGKIIGRNMKLSEIEKILSETTIK